MVFYIPYVNLSPELILSDEFLDYRIGRFDRIGRFENVNNFLLSLIGENVTGKGMFGSVSPGGLFWKLMVKIGLVKLLVLIPHSTIKRKLGMWWRICYYQLEWGYVVSISHDLYLNNFYNFAPAIIIRKRYYKMK